VRRFLYTVVLYSLEVATMKPRHHTCPHCHTPIAIERFELAVDEGITYRICPECDLAIVLRVEPAAAAVTVTPRVTPPSPLG
jgi:hypothetical protein